MMQRSKTLLLAMLLAMGFAPFAASAAAPADTQPVTLPTNDDADRDREELIRELKGETGDMGVFERVLTNMDRSQARLVVDFDPGEDTQRIQAQILKDLDEAIELARKQRSGGKKSQQRVESRTAGKRLDDKKKSNAMQPKNAGGDMAPSVKGAAEDRGVEGEIKEGGRGWGHLPERDREAVIQGLQDKHRRKYDDLIRKYYENLAQPKHNE